MSNITHDYIDNYIQSLLPVSTGTLKDMEEYARQNNIPIITPDISALLTLFIKTINAKNILEIGTAIGYSSIVMAKSAGECSQIITIEKNPALAEIAISNIKKSGYANNIKVITGEASETLDNIKGLYDIIFIDAAKGQYFDFFDKSIDKLRIGGLFICDNVLFRGMVAERSLLIRRKITIVKRLKKFLKYISENKSLQTSVIPIGDGISVSVKLMEVDIDGKS